MQFYISVNNKFLSHISNWARPLPLGSVGAVRSATMTDKMKLMPCLNDGLYVLPAFFLLHLEQREDLKNK